MSPTFVNFRLHPQLSIIVLGCCLACTASKNNPRCKIVGTIIGRRRDHEDPSDVRRAGEHSGDAAPVPQGPERLNILPKEVGDLLLHHPNTQDLATKDWISWTQTSPSAAVKPKYVKPKYAAPSGKFNKSHPLAKLTLFSEGDYVPTTQCQLDNEDARAIRDAVRAVQALSPTSGRVPYIPPPRSNVPLKRSAFFR